MTPRQRQVLFSLAVSLGAVVLALICGAVILVIIGADPWAAFRTLLFRPFSSKFGLSETLVKTGPLLLVGLGIIIAFRSGMLNIGAEGQMLAGTTAGSALALALPGLPAVILLPLTCLAGFLAGAVWGGIPGWLKARLGVNEILSTIMMNQIAIQGLLFLISGPMIDPDQVAYGTGQPQSAELPKAAWLPRLVPQTRLHLGVAIALALAVLVYVFLWRTVLGYRLRAVGANQAAARYAGIAVERHLVLAMVLSGGLAGLAGIFEVMGVHHRLLEGVSAGYGFSGIVAALFGKLHPVGAVPASFLFGALLVGAEMMQRAVGVPAAVVITMEGLVVIFVVSSDILARRRARQAALQAQEATG